MDKPILITTAGLDEHAFVPVSNNLEQRGFSTVVYKTDAVMAEEETFRLELAEDGSVNIAYNDVDISPENISAAWYRKLGNFTLPLAEEDLTKNIYIHNELRHIHETIWSIYPEEQWLNSPKSIRNADQKITQLLTAQESGFTIPKTYIGNSWEDVRDLIAVSPNSAIIVKMIRGVISEENQAKAMYTQKLTTNDCNNLEDVAQPFPGIYQPFIPKAREWRVTVVGDRIFPAAIYTDEKAGIDWRTHQLTESVNFKHEILSESNKSKCLAYLGRLGLKFGAFDLIETVDGDTVFLECNPNGQYGWLEKSLGFDISGSIADELVAIARNK